MKLKYITWIALAAGLGTMATAQVPVNMETGAATHRVAMNWAAGISKVIPGDIARRENAEAYSSEVLNAMMELARCFDANDASAVDIAKVKVKMAVMAHPEQLNDVAISADGKWAYSPIAIACYMRDGKLQDELLAAGALPYLPVHTLGPGIRDVYLSPRANGYLSDFFYMNSHELYLQAREAGVPIRVDDFVLPTAPPHAAKCNPRELPMAESLHEVGHYEYRYQAGCIARRREDIAYESDLLKAFLLWQYTVLNAAGSRADQTSEELNARVLRDIEEHPELIEDVYQRHSECDGEPSTLLRMTMWRPYRPDIMKLLFAKGALPFFPSDTSYLPESLPEDMSTALMQERMKYRTPLDVALDAQAKGIKLRQFENRIEYFNSIKFITGKRGNPYAQLPEGTHLEE